MEDASPPVDLPRPGSFHSEDIAPRAQCAPLKKGLKSRHIDRVYRGSCAVGEEFNEARGAERDTININLQQDYLGIRSTKFIRYSISDFRIRQYETIALPDPGPDPNFRRGWHLFRTFDYRATAMFIMASRILASDLRNTRLRSVHSWLLRSSSPCSPRA